MSHARTNLLAGMIGLGLLSACASAPPDSPGFTPNNFPAWLQSDGAYRFFPGDEVAVRVRTAPELDGIYTVAPDGRISPPLIGQVNVANRTPDQVRDLLESYYARELRDPSLEVGVGETDSQKVFVGGEVRTPGVYDLPGAIDPLQAILLAGGWTDEGKPAKVIVMRRAPGGELTTRTIDLKEGISKRALGEIGALQRFDVVFVTRKTIADENLFIDQFIRKALPVNFGFYYDVANN